MKRLQLAFVCLLSALASQAQEQVTGKWLTQDGDAVVEIYEADNKYYGKVVKLTPDTQEDGSPMTDQQNPDKSLRNRPILGINSIIGFDWDAKTQHLVNGKVYDPKNGKFYKGKFGKRMEN